MSKVSRTVVLSASAAIMIVAFNNCSSPNMPESTDNSSFIEKADHAYDANFDQLAYMSCSGLPSKSFDQSAYFTFRAGAYRTGGLKIRDGYIAAIEKEFRNPDEQIDMIASSPINSGSRLQLAIRSRANMQQVFTQSGQAENNEDVANFFTEIGKYELVEALFALPTGVRTRYQRNGFAYGDRFEGNLNQGDSVTLAESVRSMLTSEGMLALTYLDTAIGPTYARSPADLYGGDTSKSVYGKGLVVSFRQPTPSQGAIHGQFPNYALREVNELNLESRSDTRDLRPWSCPITMQFRIVRPGDNTGIPCSAAPDPANPSADLQLVRRSLRVEDWYVDMTNRCITPKKQFGNGCYGNNIQTVQYDLQQACLPGAPTQDCVHWASICTRQ